MKVPAKLYRILWDAHAWGGAIASVLLVGMFLLGSVSVFHEDLGPWAEPRLRTPVEATEAQTLATLQKALDARTANAPRRIDVDLPTHDEPWIRLTWEEKGTHVSELIHPVTGETARARSDLGHYLFHMHFLYPLPGGMFIAGLVATLLVLLVVSGLLIQIGKFWRETIRFRPQEIARTVWADLHKVLGSVGIPFQAMIAWTAAIICLNAMVLQKTVVRTAFDGSVDAGLASIGYPRGPKPTGQKTSAPDMAAVLEQARKSLPNADHYRLSVRNLGDAAAHVDVRGHAGQGLYDFTTVRVGQAGQLLHVREAGGPGVTSKVFEGSYVLHSGEYGGVGLRIVYALLGIFSALCVVTGNLLWMERRAHNLKRFDLVLARLTAGGCGGAALALAMIFLANQLLPDTLANRVQWEHAAFLATWCLSVVGALFFRRAVVTAQVLLAAAGSILALLPVLDAWLNGRRPFDAGAASHLMWIDVGLVVLGASLLASVAVIRKLTRREEPARVREEPSEAHGVLSSEA